MEPLSRETLRIRDLDVETARARQAVTDRHLEQDYMLSLIDVMDLLISSCFSFPS